MNNVIPLLDLAIEDAVRKIIAPLDDFCVLFSGGLDSSLLAKICLDIGCEPKLFSVYMAGSSDEKHVKKAAERMGINLVDKVISPKKIPGYIEEVSRAAQTKNPLDVSIGVPMYAGLEMASDSGYEHVMVGQGADELFAGYHRYLKMDGKELAEALARDVEEINILRDVRIAESLGVSLIFPYLDQVVVELGLSIPVDWKIRNETRKYILREVAKRRGLPEEIYAREKKAIQYSTGMDRIVRKILRNIC